MSKTKVSLLELRKIQEHHFQSVVVSVLVGLDIKQYLLDVPSLLDWCAKFIPTTEIDGFVDDLRNRVVEDRKWLDKLYYESPVTNDKK